MAEAYLGEVRVFSFGRVPKNWAACNGLELPIVLNQALFSILGSAYGGDGMRTFCLPNLNGRTPVHPTDWINAGGLAGEETNRLALGEMPTHTHVPMADGGDANQRTPVGNTWAAQPAGDKAAKPYGKTLDGNMPLPAFAPAGGGQPHDNMQPYLALNFCVCINGLYPSRD